MSESNGSTPPKRPEPHRLDRQTGEVVLFDASGRERRMRPTMAATEQIEERLSAGIDVIRQRAAAAVWPYATHIMAEPKAVPPTSELAIILHAGLQAGGEKNLTLEEAKKIIWDLGRIKVVGAIWEFVWAASDGGRLREEDLKNVASPNGSLPEPSGDQTKDDEITADLTDALRSGSSSE